MTDRLILRRLRALALAFVASAAGQAFALGPTLHFSNCEEGAAPGCVPGDNANAGTLTAPKRDLSGINLETLPGGTTLLFKRGGAWTIRQLRFQNLNTSAAAPLTFADWGTGPLPLFWKRQGSAFQLANGNDRKPDGGYVIRNLKLDGGGTGQWGILAADALHDVTVEGVEITGFEVGVHLISSAANGNVVGFTLRNSHVHRNLAQGIYGSASNVLFEGNLIEHNNPSGGSREHGVYLSGGNDIVLRNNRFIRNSVIDSGVCDGGNLTVHGQVDGLLIEGNLIEQDASLGGCWGMSVTASYTSAEWMRNVVIRGNTVVNAGHHSIRATAAPGIVIEGNKLINTQSQYQVAISVPADGSGPGDDVNRDAVVRNNVICLVSPSGGGPLGVTAPGSRVSGNTYRTGAEVRSGPCAR